MCTNCTKYNKVCEYGPPVKAPKPPKNQPSQHLFDINGNRLHSSSLGHSHPQTVPQPLSASMLYTGQPDPSVFEFMGAGIPDQGIIGSQTFANLGNDSHLGPDMNVAHTLGSNLASPSPFVSDQAQPIIGMPPYVPPTGPEVYYDPNVWVPSPPDGGQQQSFGMSQMPTSSDRLQPQLQPQEQPVSSQSFSTDIAMDYHPTYETAATSSQPRQQSVLTTSSTGSRVGSGAANYIVSVSDPPTPEARGAASGSGNTPNSEDTGSGIERPLPSSMYRQTASLHYVADGPTNVEGLTERLGEFLFSPNSSAVRDDERNRRRRKGGGSVLLPQADGTSVKRMRAEYDGLLDSFRSILLDCFLAHVTLFFEMSVPRFRYRLTFTDRRRPSLALLNTMYLWATRISNAPQLSNMEKQFFEQACTHLDISTSTVDRLIDGVRAAMLLSAYSYSSGRHHEGWCLGGLAVRVALSCGLHRIKSMVLRPAPPGNPFLRNQHFLLPPPEDAVELGERIHAFWAAFSIDRCGALATGYPSGIRDEDIKTPFNRALSDISAGLVSEADDVTVLDLYRGNVGDGQRDSNYVRWLKVVIILERASKFCYIDPDEDSPYSQAWSEYHLTLHRDPDQAQPPQYLEQPKYRNPGRFRECLLAIDQFTESLGEQGVFPVTRRAHAEQDGQPEPEISPATIMLHHMMAAVHMVLHDINSLDVENVEAVMAARRSVTLFRALPPIPFTEVDAFVVLVWSMIAKVLIKESHRLTLIGDSENANIIAADAETIISEIRRIALTMHLARTQANALDELKQTALSAARQPGLPSMSLEQFMFPAPM